MRGMLELGEDEVDRRPVQHRDRTCARLRRP